MKFPSVPLLFLLASLGAQQASFPPPVSLVTVPTAGTLLKGSYAADVRFQREGSVTMAVGVGLTDRFMFGLSYGASRLIGDADPIAYPRPEVNLKYRLIDESRRAPAVALGLDTQGYGTYNPADSLLRYDTKAYGAYVTASKNWRYPLGNVGVHLGANYNFTEQADGDEDPSAFAGIDLELNPELSILIEYNAALSENDRTAATVALNRDGYLNAALRWGFVEQLFLEWDFNNLLFEGDRVGSFSRELKITYVEVF